MIDRLVVDSARRGAALLDEAEPGWHQEIDTTNLNLVDCERCVLGQLFGMYANGIDALGLELSSDHYGFTIEPLEHEDDEAWFAEWRQLTEAWITEVEARRWPEEKRS